MSQSSDIQSSAEETSGSADHPRDIPTWAALLAGGVVLSAVGTALVLAENARAHTVRGFLQSLRSETS